MTVLHDVTRCAGAAAGMAWQTLWALVLGLGISGAIQQFASPRAIDRTLGARTPAAVLRATGLGAASSSCSYSAAAVARSLVARGADFVVAMVFMVASTNLVVELGIVIFALLGWQFLVAQLAGGVLVVIGIAAVGGIALTRRRTAGVRERIGLAAAHVGAPHCRDDGGESRMAGAAGRSARTLEGWSDAVSRSIGEARMLWRELLVGFVAAGALSVLVPAHAWQSLFLHGHGAWTPIENAAIAPLVAVVSCVCSVGNVPLAAVLWRGGIGFGGTVAFLMADVIAFPLLLVYRRYYGLRVAAALGGVLYVVIALAGLVVGAAGDALGAGRHHPIASTLPSMPSLGATTVLNVVAIGVTAALLVARRRTRATATTLGAATGGCGSFDSVHVAEGSHTEQQVPMAS